MMPLYKSTVRTSLAWENSCVRGLVAFTQNKI